MKLIHLLTIVILCAALPFSSCKDSEKERVRKEARESLPAVTPGTTSNTPATTTIANSESHYKCPDNCVGGVGATSGNCPVCGIAMAHNQAWHNKTSTTSTPTPSLLPAQSASGVYHYTCSKGCAGGAGNAGNCAVCGGALAHNQAYHN